MVIVDTSVWIDLLGGKLTLEANWVLAEGGYDGAALLDLILCEVLQGARNAKDSKLIERNLSHFPLLPTGGAELAREAARNYRLLRERGFTVRKTIDCWIATFCLREGHSLLHRDRDFDPFEDFLGLRVIHPPSH